MLNNVIQYKCSASGMKQDDARDDAMSTKVWYIIIIIKITAAYFIASILFE